MFFFKTTHDYGICKDPETLDYVRKHLHHFRYVKRCIYNVQ